MAALNRASLPKYGLDKELAENEAAKRDPKDGKLVAGDKIDGGLPWAEREGAAQRRRSTEAQEQRGAGGAEAEKRERSERL
jgi:hypothetical protein